MFSSCSLSKRKTRVRALTQRNSCSREKRLIVQSQTVGDLEEFRKSAGDPQVIGNNVGSKLLETWGNFFSRRWLPSEVRTD